MKRRYLEKLGTWKVLSFQGKQNKLRIFKSTIQHLNTKSSYAVEENVTLKAQIGCTSVPSQVPPSPENNPYPPP